MQRYGAWAVVLGASEGLGAAFARALAQRGFKLLLLAWRAEVLEEVLEEVAGPLRASTEVRTAVVDLGDVALAQWAGGLSASHSSASRSR